MSMSKLNQLWKMMDHCTVLGVTQPPTPVPPRPGSRARRKSGNSPWLMTFIAVFAATTVSLAHGSPSKPCFHLGDDPAKTTTIYVSPETPEELSWKWHLDAKVPDITLLQTPLQGTLRVYASEKGLESGCLGAHAWQSGDFWGEIEAKMTLKAANNDKDEIKHSEKLVENASFSKRMFLKDTLMDKSKALRLDETLVKGPSFATWDPDSSVFDPTTVGTWWVELSTLDEVPLLNFTMEVLPGCQVLDPPVPFAEPELKLWLFPTLQTLPASYPLDEQRWISSHPRFPQEYCEALQKRGQPPEVTLLTDHAGIFASLATPADPASMNLTVMGASETSADPKNQPNLIQITMLERQADLHNHLRAFTTPPLSLIDCSSALSLDTSLYSQAAVELHEVDTLAATPALSEEQLTLTLVVERMERGVVGQEPYSLEFSMEVAVRFKNDTDRQLTANKCLRDAPSDLKLRCKKAHLSSPNHSFTNHTFVGGTIETSYSSSAIAFVAKDGNSLGDLVQCRLEKESTLDFVLDGDRLGTKDHQVGHRRQLTTTCRTEAELYPAMGHAIEVVPLTGGTIQGFYPATAPTTCVNTKVFLDALAELEVNNHSITPEFVGGLWRFTVGDQTDQADATSTFKIDLQYEYTIQDCVTNPPVIIDSYCCSCCSADGYCLAQYCDTYSQATTTCIEISQVPYVNYMTLTVKTCNGVTFYHWVQEQQGEAVVNPCTNFDWIDFSYSNQFNPTPRTLMSVQSATIYTNQFRYHVFTYEFGATTYILNREDYAEHSAKLVYPFTGLIDPITGLSELAEYEYTGGNKYTKTIDGVEYKTTDAFQISSNPLINSNIYWSLTVNADIRDTTVYADEWTIVQVITITGYDGARFSDAFTFEVLDGCEGSLFELIATDYKTFNFPTPYGFHQLTSAVPNPKYLTEFSLKYRDSEVRFDTTLVWTWVIGVSNPANWYCKHPEVAVIDDSMYPPRPLDSVLDTDLTNAETQARYLSWIGGTTEFIDGDTGTQLSVQYDATLPASESESESLLHRASVNFRIKHSRLPDDDNIYNECDDDVDDDDNCVYNEVVYASTISDLQVMVGTCTFELVDKVNIPATVTADDGVGEVTEVIVYKEFYPTLSLPVGQYLFRPRQYSYCGTVEDDVSNLDWVSSAVYQYLYPIDGADQVTMDNSVENILYFTSTLDDYSVDYLRHQNWNIGDTMGDTTGIYITTSRSHRFRFTSVTLMDAEFMNIIITVVDASCEEQTEFYVYEDIQEVYQSTPLHYFESSCYDVTYRLKKVPDAPFDPAPWDGVDYSYQVDYPLVVDDFFADIDPVDGYVRTGKVEYTPVGGQASLAEAVDDWSLQDIQFVCDPWTRERNYQTFPIEAELNNSIDTNIRYTIPGSCTYEPCLNRIAMDQSIPLRPQPANPSQFFFPYDDQQDVDLEELFPLVHYAAVEQELPIIDIYCDFTKVQYLYEEASFARRGDGNWEPLTVEKLQSVYGVLWDEEKVTMYLNDAVLYDTRLTLVFNNTVEEENDFQNRTHLNITWLKPPCYVTSEVIAIEASNLLVNMVAEKGLTSEEVNLSQFTDSLASAFNQTTEFWCGEIGVYLTTERPYLFLDTDKGVLRLAPDIDAPIGIFSNTFLHYYYVDYPDKFLDFPIHVVIEGCEPGKLIYNEPNQIKEMVLASDDVINIEAPNLGSAMACADEIESTYSFEALSIPDGTLITDYMIYHTSNHTIDILPQYDLDLLGKGISGQIFGIPTEIPDQIFTTSFTVQYVTNGPEFEEQTGSSTSRALTCSSKDRGWSYSPPAIKMAAQQSITVTLEQESEISKIFAFDGTFLTIQPQYEAKILNGKFCPDLPDFALVFTIESPDLGKSSFEFGFSTQPAEGVTKVSFAGVDPLQIFEQDEDGKEVSKDPELSVSEISYRGEFDIIFSDDFIVLSDLSLLKEKEFLIEGTLRSNLELEIEPVDGQSSEDVEFDWTPITFTSRKLSIRLEFTKPFMISQASEKNSVQINVWDPSLFVRQKDFKAIAPLKSFELQVPAIVDRESAAAVEALASNISTAGQGITVVIFILTYGINMGMQNILSQIRNLGIITHLMMMKLQYPGTMQIFFAKIFEFVTFDLVPTEHIYPHFLQLDEVPYSEEAEQIGYGSHFFIINSGSISIFILLTLCAQLLYSFLGRVLPDSKVKNWVYSKQDSFKWTGMIDFFTDIYLTLSYCFLINLYAMPVNNASQAFNNAFSVIIGIGLIIGPFLIIRALEKGWSVKVPTTQIYSNQPQQAAANKELKVKSGDENEEVKVESGDDNDDSDDSDSDSDSDESSPEAEKAATPPQEEVKGNFFHPSVPEKKQVQQHQQHQQHQQPPQEEEKKRPQQIKNLKKMAPSNTQRWTKGKELQEFDKMVEKMYEARLAHNPTATQAYYLNQMEGGEPENDEQPWQAGTAKADLAMNVVTHTDAIDDGKTKNRRKMSQISIKEGIDIELESKRKRELRFQIKVSSRYGSIVATLKHNRESLSRSKAKCFIVMYFYRLLAQAIIVVCLYSFPEIAVICSVVLILNWNVILIVLWPFEAFIDNVTTVTNEVSVLINVYFMMCLTGQFVEPEARGDLGTSIIYFTLLNFGINLIIVFIIMRRDWMRKWKRYQYRKALKKQLERLEANRTQAIKSEKIMLNQALAAFGHQKAPGDREDVDQDQTKVDHQQNTILGDNSISALNGSVVESRVVNIDLEVPSPTLLNYAQKTVASKKTKAKKRLRFKKKKKSTNTQRDFAARVAADNASDPSMDQSPMEPLQRTRQHLLSDFEDILEKLKAQEKPGAPALTPLQEMIDVPLINMKLNKWIDGIEKELNDKSDAAWEAFTDADVYLRTFAFKKFDKEEAKMKDKLTRHLKEQFQRINGRLTRLQAIKEMVQHRFKSHMSITRDRRLFEFCDEASIDPCELLTWLLWKPIDLQEKLSTEALEKIAAAMK